MTNLKVTITEVPDPLLPDNVIAVIDGTPIVAAGKNKQEAWKELMISLAITIAHNSDLDYKELTADELKDSPYQGSAADYEEVLKDHDRLVREIDVILNGEEGAAKQASLCDLVGQIKELKEVLVAAAVKRLMDDSAAAPAGDGWVSVEEQMPEHNIGVLVFIPDEDDHITSGMWDIEYKWVLLDEYRVPECEVTHWQPLPSPPNKSV